MSNRIPYAGSKSLQMLRGPSGLVLSFTSLNASQALNWEPVDRRAHEMELRLRVTSVIPAGLAAGYIPWWVTRFIFGHGEATYTEPSPFTGEGFTTHEYTVPARGLVYRFAAREMRVEVAMGGSVPFPGPGPAPAPTRSTVALSIQPVSGMQKPVFPYAQHLFPAALPRTFAFPMDAREFRLLTVASVAPPLGSAFSMFGFGADIAVGVAASTYADWTPIPHDANRYAATAVVPLIAHFR